MAMSSEPLPESIEQFLAEPNLAVIATMRSDGRPQCVPTWYEYSNNSILLSLDAGRVRLKHMRNDPNVALSVMWHKHWFRHVSFIGHVTEIYDDVGMKDLDRLAMRYIGIPYKNRTRARVCARVAIDGWLGWDATSFAQDGVAKAKASFE